MACGGRNLTLEGLNLSDMRLPPASAMPSLPAMGAIPKIPSRLEKSGSASAIATPATGAAGATTPSSRRRRNRRQRRRKTDEVKAAEVPGLREEDEEAEADENVKEDCMPVVASSADLDVALPQPAPFAEEHLRRLQERDLLLGAEREEAAPPTTCCNAPSSDQSVKKAGSRRRRGKRKKQRSPDASAAAASKTDDKENKAVVVAEEEAKSDDDDDDDEEEYSAGPGTTKFLWRNVVKSGSVKKCVLVEGLADGTRPASGDTVLVRLQGKLKNGSVIDDHPTLVFNVGEHEVVEGLDLAVRSMRKNELSIVSVKPELAYGALGRKEGGGEAPVPANSRITYLFGLMHFEKQKEISQLTWAQRRKSGQSRMRLANWWYQRKEYPVAVKCYKKALQYYNDIPTNQECSTAEEYKELLQLMEERLRVMRQVASIFKRIANLIQSGQIES